MIQKVLKNTTKIEVMETIDGVIDDLLEFTFRLVFRSRLDNQFSVTAQITVFVQAFNLPSSTPEQSKLQPNNIKNNFIDMVKSPRLHQKCNFIKPNTTSCIFACISESVSVPTKGAIINNICITVFVLFLRNASQFQYSQRCQKAIIASGLINIPS